MVLRYLSNGIFSQLLQHPQMIMIKEGYADWDDSPQVYAEYVIISYAWKPQHPRIQSDSFSSSSGVYGGSMRGV